MAALSWLSSASHRWCLVPELRHGSLTTHFARTSGSTEGEARMEMIERAVR